MRQEQDTRQQIGALYELVNNLRAAPPEQQLPQVLANLQAKINALNESLPKLSKKITGNFPEYANLVRPKPASVEQVQQALKPDEAFVSILVTTQRTYVWAVPKQGAVAFTISALTAKEVNDIVGALRKSLDPGAVALGAIPEFDLAKAHRLYAELLKPVAPGWQAARNLVVAVNGALTQLPFALLPTEATATGALRRCVSRSWRCSIVLDTSTRSAGKSYSRTPTRSSGRRMRW